VQVDGRVRQEQLGQGGLFAPVKDEYVVQPGMSHTLNPTPAIGDLKAVTFEKADNRHFLAVSWDVFSPSERHVGRIEGYRRC
jgi:hypothetical protein